MVIQWFGGGGVHDRFEQHVALRALGFSFAVGADPVVVVPGEDVVVGDFRQGHVGECGVEVVGEVLSVFLSGGFPYGGAVGFASGFYPFGGVVVERGGFALVPVSALAGWRPCAESDEPFLVVEPLFGLDVPSRGEAVGEAFG